MHEGIDIVRANQKKDLQVMEGQKQNPRQEKMQDGLLILRDEQ